MKINKRLEVRIGTKLSIDIANESMTKLAEQLRHGVESQLWNKLYYKFQRELIDQRVLEDHLYGIK